MLSGKEKRQLRARANQIKSVVFVGKEGITGKVTEFVDQAFSNKDLIKVKIQTRDREIFQAYARELAKLAGAELVQTLGRTALFYRPLPEEREGVMTDRHIIFSDLDGTLLDYHTYSFSAADEALRLIKRRNIPLILVSSKTRAEIKDIQKEIGFTGHPFVVENGSAVYTMPDSIVPPRPPLLSGGQWCFIQGTTFEILKRVVQDLSRSNSYEIKGFHNATENKISQLTGLKGKTLQQARKREFSIPLFFDKKAEEILSGVLQKHHLKILYGGRFMHLVGMCDKGQAVRLLMEGLHKKYSGQRFISVGIGDSLNDLAMLESVDLPVLVQKHDGSYEEAIQINNLCRATGTGPSGWNSAILDILKSGGINE